MIDKLFLELSTIIIFATVLGILLKKLKQPVLLAYILSGIVLGASFLNVIAFKDAIAIFSDLGIAFLLFLVGINLDLRVLKEIGKSSIITGLAQVCAMTIAAFAVSSALGFSAVEAIYIAVALSFASTVIVVKLLSDKNELNALYAKLAVGILLLQDFMAMIVLIFISSYSMEASIGQQLANFAINIILFAIIVYAASKYLVSWIFNYIAKSQELLFLGAISWCMLLASAAMFFGFSKEIGAFLAGLLIATLPYSQDVVSKLRYLRDFFILLFFVALGANLVIGSSAGIIIPAIILSALVLLVNPLIVMLLMLRRGYSARTSLLSGTCLAQVSEFSLIIVALGQGFGHISKEITSLITLVAVITIMLSTYVIVNSRKIYGIVEKYIKPLQKHEFFEDSLASVKEKYYRMLFIGFGKTGKSILNHIDDKSKNDLLIVEFDPKIVKEAIKQGFNCIYGDAADSEMINFMIRHRPKIVVSTVADFETNRLIAKKLKASKVDSQIIMLAARRTEARKLSKEGVDFVLIPAAVAGKMIGTIINDLMQQRSLELGWMKKETEEDYLEI